MPRPSNLTEKHTLHVVVLVLENNQGEILITKRPAKKHLAGYWEFPGGKLESQESLINCIRRECCEELNYQPIEPRKILDYEYQYPEFKVSLHVFHEVNSHPHVSAAENQLMQWVTKQDLTKTKLPPANQPIVDYLLSTQSK